MWAYKAVLKLRGNRRNIYGNSTYRKRGRPDFTHEVPSGDRVRGKAEPDMHETFEQANGVGLAAPQVGYCRRFFIMHLGDVKIEAINPEIKKTSGKQYVLEGCLSVPNKWGYVTRPNKCKFRAQNRKGEWYEMTLSGLGAQCVCHENAHLDGQLFIDVVEEFVDPEDLEEA